jgi:putative ABC transport system substrate-binding protein
VKRRAFILALGGAVAWPLAARSQQLKSLRVGYVGIQSRDLVFYVSFRKRIGELGYSEGRNFTFEYIQTPDLQGYEPAYRELAARKVDVFLAVGSEAALRAAQVAAGTLPIAFLAVDFDPVAKGYITSLRRPGTNITGILVQQIELAAKRVEILHELLPRMRKIGFLWDAASRDQADAGANAAKALGLIPLLIEIIGQRPDYVSALQIVGDGTDLAVVVPASPHLLRDRTAIGQALTDTPIPSISAFREVAETGALISYGVDLNGLFRDMADCVVRLAKGSKPAETPMEQANRFHMAINLKSAARLGIFVPNAFAARANEVIE